MSHTLRNSPANRSRIAKIRFILPPVLLLSVIFHKEKPVANPRDIPGHFPQTGHTHREILFLAPTRNVGDRNLAVGMQLGGDDTNGRLDSMFARTDFPQVRQLGHQSDGAEATHAQAADVVEKNHARRTGFVLRFDEQSADQNVGTARFIDNR